MSDPWDLDVIIPGEPIAQPRPRSFACQGRDGRVRAKVYRHDKHPVHAYRQAVRLLATSSWRQPPIDGPVEIIIEAVFGRPKSRTRRLVREAPRTRRPIRPDFDNVAKAVCDALTGLVWGDDGQITDAHVVKREAASNEAPHTRIRVRAVSIVPGATATAALFR
jgi:Holliday junction resolvase RusA-like endonuclease